MPKLYESTIGYFCDPNTCRIETSVVVSKKELIEHVTDLPISTYEKNNLFDTMNTKNPYGGATYTPIADVLREYIGDWLEETFGFDTFHLNNKDFKYMFQHAQKFKSVGVSIILPKKQYHLLLLKNPKEVDMIKSSL